MILHNKFYALLLTVLLLTLVGCDNMSATKTNTVQLDDTSLNLNVTEALQKDTLFERGTISVTSLNGQVKLNGTAASLQDKNQATEIANKVKGVRGVQNNLQVIAPPVVN